ncbi:alpha/beta fold hydrolase [Pseudonocardia sp. KRD-169]|uniref:Alpha/beta fold hydrolase n=2 Tax=Pseudonocardia abyssalis TaxID=2792008 RepID=A0ABS6UNM5_9PSEU|nr:alpha/beta fold hydrolase [Pseudonocardia abyssalis]MBW0133772.1 alpha/beta fold hydrolase [Pseudonocardia abyssalis]
MVLGALLGLVAGGGTGTAWTVLPTSAVYGAVLELGRLAVALPTVDAVRLDSVYGVLALLAGRGVHALLLVLPMLLGARIGVGIALRRSGAVPHRARRAIGTGVVGLVVVAMAAFVAVPASTPPVVDATGAVVPGGLASLETVTLGGTGHALMIRAADVDDPVLLYLSGGPGQSDLALARVLSAPWTDDVVFATYDQRGNGKSYAGLLPTGRATLDRAVEDTIALSEQLRDRFGEEKILLMGESWGTLLGVLAVQRRPDLYHAWIGSGQMVDVQETDRRIHTDLQAYASRTGDTDLAATLERIGVPPYRDIPWANAAVMDAYGRLYGPYTPSAGYLARGAASGLDPFGLLGSEYDAMEKANVLRGLVDTFAVMYPQIQDLDLRRDVPALQVPVYVLDGAAELHGRRDLMLEWYGLLDAPEKHLVTYEGAAHAVAFEQADEVHRLLVEDILPRTGTP